MTTPYVLDNPPAPGTEAWTTAITASKVPPMARNPEGEFAGLGYITAFEQYEQLKGRFTQEFSTFMLARFEQAHAMEEPAAQWWVNQQARPQDWELSEGEVAFHNPAFPALDFATVDRVATNTVTGEKIALEVKNPDNPGLQPGWVIQRIAQQIASGLKGGVIVAPRTGVQDFQFFELNFSDTEQEVIEAHILYFKELLDTDTPPPGGVIELAEDELDELKKATQAVKDAEAHLKQLKAKYLEKLGKAKSATFNGTPMITRTAGSFAKNRVPKDQLATLEDPDVTTTTTVTKFNEEAYANKYPDLYAQAIAGGSLRFLPSLSK